MGPNTCSRVHGPNRGKQSYRPAACLSLSKSPPTFALPATLLLTPTLRTPITTPRAHPQHISIDAMHGRIKRVWFSSRAAFLRSKERALAETGESVSAGEWRGEGEVSEVSLRPARDWECGVVRIYVGCAFDERRG